jgi:hypothetical protein
MTGKPLNISVFVLQTLKIAAIGITYITVVQNGWLVWGVIIPNL